MRGLILGWCWLWALLGVAEPQVDINTATAKEIATGLIGIGLKRAEAIVRYRDEVGEILTIEELLVIQGIGEKTLEKNRSRIVTGLMNGVDPIPEKPTSRPTAQIP